MVIPTTHHYHPNCKHNLWIGHHRHIRRLCRNNFTTSLGNSGERYIDNYWHRATPAATLCDVAHDSNPLQRHAPMPAFEHNHDNTTTTTTHRHSEITTGPCGVVLAGVSAEDNHRRHHRHHQDHQETTKNDCPAHTHVHHYATATCPAHQCHMPRLQPRFRRA